MPKVYGLHPGATRPNIYKQDLNASCHFVVQKGKKTMFIQATIF